MSLRLSTGFCHGMLLQEPASETRPTASRVRSAVLNSLQERLAGARFLDLFAGSGAVGIEALSRGAHAATFVEHDRSALKALKANLDELGRRAQKQGIKIATQVLSHDARRALDLLAGEAFDVIWLDPPYAALTEVLPALAPAFQGLLQPEGILVVESDAGAAAFVPQCLAAAGWDLSKQKVYGRIAISYLHPRPSENNP